MAKILGLDPGTNSIGWAVVEKEDGEYSLDKGVRIFQEGVKIEKGIESSKAAERTEHRSARRLKYRRKLRKIETLKVLSEYGYCPQLTNEELNLWRYKKIYPQNISFCNWWHTDEDSEKHPYFFRNLAITQQLDLNKEEDKHKLGRAFYHMAQRRGFLSNRLDSTPENETGKVKSGIKELQEKKGDRTLGQYFYEDCYLKGEKIRNQYTSREDDYLDEFKRICAFQNIPEELQQKLYKAIFYQRPLKSQKGLIGKCVFEPTKPRCAVSRPEFEEYRMLCFINNIKIKTPDDEKLRPLNAEERSRIVPRFFLQREHFDFEDLAKQLAPKKQYKYYKDRNKNPEDHLLNYSMKATVSGCPVSARLKDLFGADFIDDDYNYVKDSDNRTPKLISDAWHALNTFDSDKKLKEYAQKHFDFNEDKMTLFSEKIRLKQDFASLSLKAINKILPYLREGLIYSHAVFLANMEETVPAHVWKNEENRKIIRTAIKEIIENHSDNTTIVNMVNGFITNARRENEVWSEEAKQLYFNDLDRRIKTAFGAKRFENFSEYKKSNLINKAQQLITEFMPKNLGKGEHVKVERLDEAVLTFLADNFGKENLNAKKLYHPSAIETYKPAKRGKDGRLYLGSPMTSSVRNPMAMRALHQLRLVINELIKTGLIDTNTKINIEMSRGLLNANERTGLKRWQDDREKKRKEYIERIKEHFSPDYQPSEDEVLKYQLWEEQRRICLYTGKPINIEDFLGSDPKFDIEHTIPRSQSYDNSQENKTLCENEFNRKIKRNRIPYELSNHEEILVRIEHWKEEIEKLEKEIQMAVRQSKGAADKDQKDKAIQKRHQLTYECSYWQNKYKRFAMEEVPEGFKNSQMVDIGIITKYSRLYLKTVFPKVYTVKGNTVADFRKMWGLQDNYTKKARVNHVHHCIDAITIACMDKSNYETLAKFYHDSEDAFERGHEAKPEVEKPWATFTEDVKEIEKEILVSHHTPDVLPKQSKMKLRKRGKIQYKKNGEPIYLKGDSVRGSLHKDTFYGAIEREVLNKNGEAEKQIKYVVRKSLDGLEDSAIKNIVDDRVREIVSNAKIQEKELQKQIDDLLKQRKKAEEDEELDIDNKIAVLKQQIVELYCLPNKNGASVPIKKVRIYQPMVTNPLPGFKKHRDLSGKKYKQQYNVANDGNYAMAVYEGVDRNENLKRSIVIVNNFGAGKFFNGKLEESPFPDKHPKTGLYLKYLLKTGTLVMFWEKSPEELRSKKVDKVKRLYKVTKMDKDGRITFKFHQEARNDESLKLDYEKEYETKPPKTLTNGESFVDFVKPFPKVRLSPPNFNFIVEDYDFKISTTGEIKWLNENL
jgi:CRISPR-associated endonuclease Csn1